MKLQSASSGFRLYAIRAGFYWDWISNWIRDRIIQTIEENRYKPKIKYENENKRIHIHTSNWVWRRSRLWIAVSTRHTLNSEEWAAYGSQSQRGTHWSDWTLKKGPLIDRTLNAAVSSHLPLFPCCVYILHSDWEYIFSVTLPFAVAVLMCSRAVLHRHALDYNWQTSVFRNNKLIVCIWWLCCAIWVTYQVSYTAT